MFGCVFIWWPAHIAGEDDSPRFRCRPVREIFEINAIWYHGDSFRAGRSRQSLPIRRRGDDDAVRVSKPPALMMPREKREQPEANSRLTPRRVLGKFAIAERLRVVNAEHGRWPAGARMK